MPVCGLPNENIILNGEMDLDARYLGLIHSNISEYFRMGGIVVSCDFRFEILIPRMRN
jgi:hypothetical protein